MKLLDLLEVKVDTHGSFLVKQDLYLILNHRDQTLNKGWCITPERDLDEFQNGTLKRGDKLIHSHDLIFDARVNLRYPNYKVITKSGIKVNEAEFSPENLAALINDGALRPI